MGTSGNHGSTRGESARPDLHRRLLSPATIPLGFIFKHRLFMWCVWQTIGWASYLVAKKPDNVKGEPAFRYYLPESHRRPG